MRQQANLKTIFNVELYKTIVGIYQDLFWAIPARYYESFKDEVIEAQEKLEYLNPIITDAVSFTHNRASTPEEISVHMDLMEEVEGDLELLREFLIRNVGFTADVPHRNDIVVNELNSGELTELRDRLMDMAQMINQVIAGGALNAPIDRELVPNADDDTTVYADYFQAQVNMMSQMIHDAANVIQFGSDQPTPTVDEIRAELEVPQLELSRVLQAVATQQQMGEV